MAYIAPADQVVYEEQPAAAAKLLSQPGYRRAQTDWKFPPTMDPVAFAPPEFDRWRRMYVPQPSTDPTLFLHRLQNPRKGERFVHLEAVNFTSPREPQGRVIMLLWAVSKPGSWRPGDEPTLITSSNAAPTLSGLQPGDFVRIYAGQPDPTDPTRFTVRVDVNGATARIVGRLNAADKLDLELQDWPRELVGE
jgi:hypothetical protein